MARTTLGDVTTYNPISVQTLASTGLIAQNGATAGDVALVQPTGDLSIGTGGATITNGFSGGAIDVTASAGSITETASSTLNTTGNGNVWLIAQGFTGNVNINGNVYSGVGGAGSGTVYVTAANNVNFADVGAIKTTGGNVTVTADTDSSSNAGGADTYGISGAITMGVTPATNTSSINAGSGSITLSAYDDVLLGSLTTSNATGAAVSVTSTAGAILDNNAALNNVTDSAAGTLTLTANTYIGRVKGGNVLINPSTSSAIANDATNGNAPRNGGEQFDCASHCGRRSLR